MRFPESWTVFPLGRSSLLAVPGQVQEFLTLASQKSDWRTGFSLYKSMHPSDLEEPEGESRKQKKKRQGASSPFQQTKQQRDTKITTAATSTTTRSTAAANDRAGWQPRPVEQPRKSIYDGR